MGSTSLGSLIEKYGFINLPFRKFLLSEYVMGVRKLTDKSMQYRCIETINTLSEKLCLGGTSVKDRDSRKAKIRTLKPNKDEINNFLSFEPETLESLLSHCFIFLSKYTAYKEIKMPIKGFIIYEMPQFKIKYNFTQSEYIKVLIKKANFECFIMNRSFKEWCASLLSQQDYKAKNLSNKSTVSLEKLYKRWMNIQHLSKNKDVHPISIESALYPNTEKLNKLISKVLNRKPKSKKFLISQQYDLFGSLLSYESAFKPSDKSFSNANFINQLIFENYTKFPKTIRYLINIFFNILRIFGFLKVY